MDFVKDIYTFWKTVENVAYLRLWLFFIAGTFITIPLHEDEAYDPVDAVWIVNTPSLKADITPW